MFAWAYAMRRLSRLRGIESYLSTTSTLHYLDTETCMLFDSINPNRFPWKELYSNKICSLHNDFEYARV